jgi:hypothetical protein
VPALTRRMHATTARRSGDASTELAAPHDVEDEDDGDGDGSAMGMRPRLFVTPSIGWCVHGRCAVRVSVELLEVGVPCI